eukprot:TRINITY_DN74517_c0_g1_i1.p1 TRINITY_DN74517_c0_g1~~TRINITY_DN74517_c0_g1_i1.p1  ORF type:complete len:508 (+),score=82.31 TRINITY_DN74517_c0_g1_i1:69-1592(+)
MAVVPWYNDKSYIASGWHTGSVAMDVPLLPNLRRFRDKGLLPAEDGSVVTATRPLSAATRRSLCPPFEDRIMSARPTGAGKFTKATTAGLGDVGSRNAVDTPGTRQKSPMRLPPSLPPSPYHQASRSDSHNDAVVETHEDDTETEATPFLEYTLADESCFLEAVATLPSLRRLNLSDNRHFSSECFERVALMLPKLRELNLRGTYIDDAGVAAFVTNCPGLEVLDVSECSLSDLSCISAMSGLREFRAARCAHAMTSAVVSSLRVAEMLQVLDLTFCIDVDNQALLTLSEGLHLLTELYLCGCTKISDSGMLALSAANPNIVVLSLRLVGESLTDDCVARCLRCLKRARTIDLGGCRHFGRQTALAIARYCECAEDLSFMMNDVGDGQLQRLFARCRHLRRLDLSGCQLITDEGISYVTSSAAVGTNSLQKLVLTHAHNLSNEAIANLTEQLPDLQIERAAQKFIDPNDLNLFLGPPWKPKPKPTARKKKVTKVEKGRSKSPRKKKR